MAKFYTGIGSRKTPEVVLNLMTLIAQRLERMGWILRSGGAGGADTAFENGVKYNSNKHIYLPWRGFNNSKSRLHDLKYDLEAQELASNHHPGWIHLKPSVRKLMGRNTYQVLGEHLDKKSTFVICWTPDGANSQKTRNSKTGGTGLAISLADSLGIPIYNLHNLNDIIIVLKKLNIKISLEEISLSTDIPLLELKNNDKIKEIELK